MITLMPFLDDNEEGEEKEKDKEKDAKDKEKEKSAKSASYEDILFQVLKSNPLNEAKTNC